MDIVTWDQVRIAGLLPAHPDALADARAVVTNPDLAATIDAVERRFAWLVLIADHQTRRRLPWGTAA